MVGSSLSWCREALLADAGPRAHSQFTWAVPLKSGLTGGLQNNMWVVLCHSAMTEKFQVVAADSNPHRPGRCKRGAGGLTILFTH